MQRRRTTTNENYRGIIRPQPTHPDIVKQHHADENTEEQFDNRLLWWKDVTPAQMLSTRHPTKTHIPDGAIAQYNDIRTRLLERCTLPKENPLHRNAWMAFSALELLIMAPNNDDASGETNLQITLRRLQAAQEGNGDCYGTNPEPQAKLTPET